MAITKLRRVSGQVSIAPRDVVCQGKVLIRIMCLVRPGTSYLVQSKGLRFGASGVVVGNDVEKDDDGEARPSLLTMGDLMSLSLLLVVIGGVGGV